MPVQCQNLLYIKTDLYNTLRQISLHENLLNSRLHHHLQGAFYGGPNTGHAACIYYCYVIRL